MKKNFSTKYCKLKKKNSAITIHPQYILIHFLIFFPLFITQVTLGSITKIEKFFYHYYCIFNYCAQQPPMQLQLTLVRENGLESIVSNAVLAAEDTVFDFANFGLNFM